MGLGHKLQYLSWSQIYTYLNDPQDYFNKYVLGIWPEPNEAMKLGSIYHKAFENPENKIWIEELRKENFTSDKERMIWDAIKYLNKFKWPNERELKIRTSYLPIDLLGIYDGYTTNVITEYKTGKANWTQQRVNDDNQLKLYSLIHKMKWNVMPTVILHSFNTTSGRCKTFKVKHKVRDLQEIKRMVKEAHKGITLGIWNL